MDPTSPLYSYLTPEEHVLIRASCVSLSEESKQQYCFRFWGKIFGVQNDYFVIQSSTWNPYEQPIMHYSRDCSIWAVLPPSSDNLLRSNLFLSGPLTGDPMAPYSYTNFTNSGKSPSTEPISVQIREEDRLAYLVRAIDGEGILTPKGAYATDASGQLKPNPTYKGMSYEDCCNLENYCVFLPLNKSQPRKDVRGRPLNVLPPLLTVSPDNITERASWRFQDKIYENYVMLYNINWPGLNFYHAIDGSSYGRFYFGRGCKEINIPFSLAVPGENSVHVDVGFMPDYDFKRTPEEAERAAAAVAAALAAKLKKEAQENEFLVSDGEKIRNLSMLNAENDLSESDAPTTEPFSVQGDTHDDTSVEGDGTENTSGDESAAEPDSDAPSIN